jgi:GT2 family glycosyltransferase
LSENTGFAKANEEGLKASQGEYIMLVNNDVVIDKDCVRNLLQAMETYPEVGICASKMIVHGQDNIDSAGDGFTTSLKGYKRGEGLLSSAYNEEGYIFGACAGAALYRKKMIDEIGFLDEAFFLIHEDSDFNFRAQLAGWKVYYIPSAIAFHKVRSTIGTMSDMEVYHTLRNIEFVRFKNIPSGLLIRCLPGCIVGSLTEFIYYSLKHGRPGLYLKAKRDAIRNLAPMLEKRKEIMKLKKVENRYLHSVLTPLLSKELFFRKLKKFFYK